MVIRRTDLLTVNRAAALAQYAKEGLPVIISDGIPTQIASTTGLAQAQSRLGNDPIRIDPDSILDRITRIRIGLLRSI